MKPDNRQSGAMFKTTQYPIKTLIDDIDYGRLSLPEMQRPFVWKSTKVRDLFDSIYRGYPVGYLLFWENVKDQAKRDIGVDEKEDRAKSLIIDGQQRLTTLFATIKGIPIIDDNYKEKRLRIAFNPLTEEFVVSNAATERNDNYISDISELFGPKFGEYEFINRYLESLGLSGEISEDQKRIIPASITKLRGILSYNFTVLEIAESVSEEEVANIFVRVNSQGKALNQSDFVLTLLSVFWEEGRRLMEDFSRQSSDPNYRSDKHSSYNPLVDVKPGDILRAIVGYGFGRGRMADTYALLRGRDFTTREYTEELQGQRFQELERYTADGLDNTTWLSYINLLQSIGFKHKSLITSRTNLFYSYAFYLIGKHRYGIEFHQLEKITSRWFVMSALKARYSGSSESVFEGDLALIRPAKTGEDFVRSLDNQIGSEITNDFWDISMPNTLVSSSSKNPQWLVFIAAQLRNNVELLFSSRKLSDAFDPTVIPKKSQVDIHHIFPKNYLNSIGVNERTYQNQVANYLHLDFRSNIQISDTPPSDYFRKYKNHIIGDVESSLASHALPLNFFDMDYEDYLLARRHLMSQYVRAYFESI